MQLGYSSSQTYAATLAPGGFIAVCPGRFFRGAMIAQVVAEAFQYNEHIWHCVRCNVFWRWGDDCKRCGQPNTPVTLQHDKRDAPDCD